MNSTVCDPDIAIPENITATVNTDRAILTVMPHSTVDTAAKIMSRHHVGGLVVVNTEGYVVGILTERDVVAEVVSRSLVPSSVPVRQIMSRKVISCSENTPLSKAQHIMARHNVRHLPIVESGKPVGMISSRDILSHQLSTVKSLAQKQYKLLQEVEEANPGITNLEKDDLGRILI